MVGLDDLLGQLDVALSEGVDCALDHGRGLLAHLDELAGKLDSGLVGDLLDEKRHVAGHAVDVGEVGDDAEGAGDKAQVVADEGLLEEHRVKATVLDGLAQAVLRLAALHDALLGSAVARGGKASGADVGRALLLEADDVLLDALELARELGTRLESHQLNLPERYSWVLVWRGLAKRSLVGPDSTSSPR